MVWLRPRARSDAGFGVKRASSAFLGKGAGVYGGGGGDRIRRCFRPGVGVGTSISRTVRVCVLGRQGVPSIGPPVRTGVCGWPGVPSAGSSIRTGVCGCGRGSTGISGGSCYSTSNGGSLSFGTVGSADTCPLSKGDRRRPSSARESAFSLPRVPTPPPPCLSYAKVPN